MSTDYTVTQSDIDVQIRYWIRAIQAYCKAALHHHNPNVLSDHKLELFQSNLEHLAKKREIYGS